MKRMLTVYRKNRYLFDLCCTLEYVMHYTMQNNRLVIMLAKCFVILTYYYVIPIYKLNYMCICTIYYCPAIDRIIYSIFL